MPITKVDNYRVTLVPRKDQQWYKEVISLRRASRDLECNECNHDETLGRKQRAPCDGWNEGRPFHADIKKGELYIRDKFYYEGYRGHRKVVVNFVCLKCWKGPIPKNESNNWVRNGKPIAC